MYYLYISPTKKTDCIGTAEKTKPRFFFFFYDDESLYGRLRFNKKQNVANTTTAVRSEYMIVSSETFVPLPASPRPSLARQGLGRLRQRRWQHCRWRGWRHLHGLRRHACPAQTINQVTIIELYLIQYYVVSIIVTLSAALHIVCRMQNTIDSTTARLCKMAMSWL